MAINNANAGAAHVVVTSHNNNNQAGSSANGVDFDSAHHEYHSTNNINTINNNSNNDNNVGQRLLTSSYRAFPHPADLGDRYVAFFLRNERTTATLQRHVLMDHLAIARQQTNGGAAAGGGAHSMEDVLGSMLSSTQTASSNDNSNHNGEGANNGSSSNPSNNKQQRANASIEIDAFQLLTLDPVLGHLTLRYPDTLLELLEDSTVQARRVLRRRMEVAMSQSLDKLKRSPILLTSTSTSSLDKDDANINKNNAKKKKQTQKQKRKSQKEEINHMIQLLNALKHTGTNNNYNPRPLHARLVHLPPHSSFCKPTLSSLRAKDVGTIIQISGTCVRTGPIRMMETIRTYTCLGKGCRHTFRVAADFGTTNNALPMPTICPQADNNSGGGGSLGLDDIDNNEGMMEPCRSTSFAVVPNASEHADYQEMKVQESASASNCVGSVPRSILIKLSDDLVDGCNPEEEVVVVGSLHAEWQGNQGLRLQ